VKQLTVRKQQVYQHGENNSELLVDEQVHASKKPTLYLALDK
jgi:hypothetical protein